MKITLRHPAFITAKQKGGRVARPTVIIKEAEFEIRTITAQDAPVAYVVDRDPGDPQGFRKEIREYDGRLYGQTERSRYKVHNKLETPITQDELITAASTDPLSNRGLFSRTAYAIRRCVMSVGDQGVVPSGIHRVLHTKDVTDAIDITSACQALVDQIVVDDTVEAEIEGWRQAIQKELDEYICVDGEVLAFCGEPIYVPANPVSVVYPEVDPVSALATFNALDFEAALEEHRRLERINPPSEHRSRMSTSHIEVTDPETVTWNAEERDFDRYARSMEKTIHERIVTIGERYKNVRIPRPVYDTWLDLRDAIESYDIASSNVPDNLDDIVAAAVTEYSIMCDDLVGTVEYIKAPNADKNAFILARFADRRIEFDQTPMRTIMP